MKWKQQPNPLPQREVDCTWAVCSPCFLCVCFSVRESMAPGQTDSEEHASVGELWGHGSAEWEVVEVLHRQTLLVLNSTGIATDMAFIPLWEGLDLFFGFAFSLVSGRKNVEEGSAGTPLAPAHSLWTADAKGSVRLRIEEGCPEEPVTVHQMFKASVEKYGNMYALASKKNNEWEKTTFSEYYQFCRRAAKSFIKVYYTKREHMVYDTC